MIKNPPEGRGRILVLSSTFPRWEGDTEPGFVFDLCRHLAAELEVTVLAPHAAGARLRETLAGVSVVRYRYGPSSWEKLAYGGGIMANLRRNPLLFLMLPPFFLGQLVALLALMRRLRPAALHAHWIVPQGMVLAAALPGRTRPRAICTAHGSDVSALRGGFWRRLRRWVTLRCDRTVAVSEALKAQLVSEGCPPERIDVIPMGADLRRLFVPDGSPRSNAEILFVGRLVPGKGVDILLNALPAVLAKLPEARLTVVGDGPERASLIDLTRRLDLESRVAFAGSVAHASLAAHYRRAALLVLPSREEGFGLVLVEALGCGCPVVASGLPAIRSLLLEGQAGRLFQAGNAADLSQAITGMLADGARSKALAERGRQHVLSQYDWQAIARRYAALLMPAAAAGESGGGHA